jgi:hypothetical protein
LVDDIGAENLPVEYGGTCQCGVVDGLKSVWGGVQRIQTGKACVPPANSAVDALDSLDPPLTDVDVVAGKRFFARVRLPAPAAATVSAAEGASATEGGVNASWFFRTLDKDIKFSASFVPLAAATPMATATASSPGAVVVADAAVHRSFENRIVGEYAHTTADADTDADTGADVDTAADAGSCGGEGVLVLCWDNSGSWLSSKTLRYNVDVVDADGKVDDVVVETSLE